MYVIPTQYTYLYLVYLPIDFRNRFNIQRSRDNFKKTPIEIPIHIIRTHVITQVYEINNSKDIITAWESVSYIIQLMRLSYLI